MNSNQTGYIHNFDQFKSEMVQIQEKTLQLKKKLKADLTILRSKENDLSDELDFFFNTKIGEWSRFSNVTGFEYVPPKVRTKISEQNGEVKRFFDFIHQSRGHENGWREEDHMLFLNLRKKYSEVDDLACELHDILPDISIDQIKSHEKWYKEYLILRSRKKNAIEIWKRSQEKNNLEPMVDKQKNARSRKVDTSKLKEQVIQWKLEKEEALQQEKEMETQKVLDRIQKDRLKKQKQIEVKKIVNEWKQSKIFYEQTKKYNEMVIQEIERKKKTAQANRLIKQFQSMDQLHILKMKDVNKNKTDEPKNLVRYAYPDSRDPERLLKPTMQWIHRVRAGKESTSSQLLSLFAVPKLAIPEWRKTVE